MSESGEAFFAASVLAVCLISSGTLMVWLGRRSLTGSLKRNPIAGVRTALTMSSDTAWIPAQRAAGRPTSIAGWGAIAGGACSPAIAAITPAHLDVTVLTTVSLVSAGWMLVWVLVGAVAGQRAAREATKEAEVSGRTLL